jgi:hypothetical protein
MAAKKQAAEWLVEICEAENRIDESNEYARFLVPFSTISENQSHIKSQLAKLHHNFVQERQDVLHQKRIKKNHDTVNLVIGLLFGIIAIVAILYLVNKKRHQNLRVQHEEMGKLLETERYSHKMQQAALSGRLKRSNEELRELKDQIRQRNDAVAKTEAAASFTEEPVCRLILERVKEGRFKSKVDCTAYKDFALNKQQLLDLRLAADRHYDQFTVRLKKAYPELTQGDLDYCCLYLLGLTDADIAALMQRAYNTVIERNGKMRKIFGSENPLPITLKSITNGFSLA